MAAVMRCIVLAAASCLFAAPVPAAPADDRALSVGLWDVVAVEANGREIDPELVALLRVAYRADGSWSVLFKGLTLAEGTSTNDQAAAPKTFEMETPAGEHARPQRYVGIYRLDDDVRMLCFVEEGKPRPDEFAAPRGSGRVLVQLRRSDDRRRSRRHAGRRRKSPGAGAPRPG